MSYDSRILATVTALKLLGHDASNFAKPLLFEFQLIRMSFKSDGIIKHYENACPKLWKKKSSF